MDLITTLYLQVFPYGFVLLAMLWGYVILFAPKNLKTELLAWIRPGGVIMRIFDDDAVEKVEYMSSSKSLGVFAGGAGNYIFIPRPSYLTDNQDKYMEPATDKDGNVLMEEDGTTPKMVLKEVPSASPKDAEAIANIAQHRFSTGYGRPLYLGYRGKAVALNPKLLAALEEAHRGQGKRTTYTVTLEDPRILKQLLPKMFNQSGVNALRREAYDRGKADRPLDGGGFNVRALLLLLLLGVFVYLWFTGKIPFLPKIG